MVCRIYRWACRKWGPRIDGRRVTVSAWAFWRGQQGHSKWLRNRIDGWWLLRYSVHNHCQSAYQRSRAPTDAKGPRK
jgi:hypothetical protein